MTTAPDGSRPPPLSGDPEEERGLREILQQAPLILFALDAQGRVLLAEGGLLRRDDLPAPEPGQTLLERFAGTPTAEAIRRALRGERFEFATRLPPGELEAHFFPWEEAPGGPGAVGLVIDVTDRERTLRELRASEERLRLISEHASQMISEYGPDSEYLFVSRSLAEALGTTRQALLREHAADRIHPEDLPDARRACEEKGPAGGPVRTRVRVRRNDGAWRWFESVSRAFTMPDGMPHAVSVTRDVTEERLEEERRERELRLLEQASRIGGELVACPAHALEAQLAAALERTGRIARADRAVVVLLSASGGPLRHLFWSARPEDAEPDLERLTALARSRVVERGETLHLPRAGESTDEIAAYVRERGIRSSLTLPLRTGDGASGFLGLVRTREARGWSEEEIDVLHLVADALAEGLVREGAERVLGDRRRLQSEITALARRLLGVRPEDLDRELVSGLALAARVAGLESALMAAWDPQDRRLLEVHQQVHPEDTDVGHGHVRSHRWLEAQVRRGEVVALPARDAFSAEAKATLRVGTRALLVVPIEVSERFVAYLTAWSRRDRTPWSRAEIGRFRLVGELLAGALRRRQTERAVRASEEQLTRTQKMETVGRLAGHIAHDFNNLLTVIAGNAEVIAQELASPRDREDVRAIRRAAERAAQLTRDLLAFSRGRPGTPEVVLLNDVVRGVTAFLERTLGDDIDLELRLRPEAGRVRVEADRLRQILVNLALNGRDAMPRGGRLCIDTRAVTLSPRQAERLGVQAPGPHAVLEVRDEGTGMEAAILDRAIEPFFTTKRSGTAVGLGLSIAYSTLKERGGTVEIDSTPGAGTCVRLFLPRAPEDLPDPD